MIIVKVTGGLGNQMFQYAFGRALAFHGEAELRLDLRSFNRYTLHYGFELKRVFGIETKVASESDIHAVIGWRGRGVALQALMRPQLSWLRGRRLIVEPHFHFWPAALNAPSTCFVVGYWQSEKYFQRIKETIYKDFSFNTPFTGKNANIAELIHSCSAVSLHVRRGDYVSNPKTFATHGVCDLDYYRRAVDFIAMRVPGVVFFVFSDDIDWAQKNLSFKFPCHFIDHNTGEEGFNDMRLMSLCRHHIIANSSFSWWGAWLNSSPNKIVVAPKQWFAGNYFDTRDLIPKDWVRT